MSDSVIKLVFLFLVAIVSVKYILFWTYVWQLKEYRWDRFRDFLRSREGRDAFFNKFYFAKFFCAILGFVSFGLIFFTMGYGGKGLPYEKAEILIFISNVILVIIFFLLFFEVLTYLKRILNKKAKHPVFTKKAFLLILISGIINFYFILTYLNWDKEFFAPLSLVILAFIPLFIGFANLIIHPFSKLFKERKLEVAGRIMENFSGAVIGITGSYGKTSVKEFTAVLLGKKFAVVKTLKNVNTEIGVAGFIMNTRKDTKQNTNQHELKPPVSPFLKGGMMDYFICEMGAYRVGEIEKMCKMVKPKIGILTGINEQHLALFGSIENTIKAKSELINFLPSDGLAIINWDDENCRKVVVPAGIRKLTYGFAEGADCIAEIRNSKFEIRNNKRTASTKFLVKFKNEKQEINLQIIGKHNIQNLLPAIIVAREAGISWDEVIMAVEDLKALDNGIKIKEMDGAVIIDDTYNSNPAGVRAAIEVLDNMDRKYKVLVLDDIWELGKKEGQRIHRELAEEISKKNYDKIILVGKEYADIMKDIMVANGVDEKRIILGGDRTLFYSDMVVLFEGRRSEKFLIHLISNSSFGELRTSSNKISNS